ncbi:hypothetical protein E2C01_039018 [Portunus trituberculatus]|uniref:Uncharacterized protein n=1 Tax=Portunus trituberculatus TaxID=210409 RepID=A0A5B7FFQ5_PORTR|nr:hypothetical protein [Portunus trituberculatus]
MTVMPDARRTPPSTHTPVQTTTPALSIIHAPATTRPSAAPFTTLRPCSPPDTHTLYGHQQATECPVAVLDRLCPQVMVGKGGCLGHQPRY